MSMTMKISTMNRSNREIHGLVPPPVVPHESAGSLHHSARPFKGYRHVSGVPFLKTTADAFAHQFKAKVAFTIQLQEDTSQYRANAGCLARRQGSDWVEICITGNLRTDLRSRTRAGGQLAKAASWVSWPGLSPVR
jgi:hypothetical protein